MRKIAFVSLILPLLLAPVGSILAQETGSSTEAVKDAWELPSSPLDDLINKWLGGGSIKEAAQSGMTKAQSGIKEATGQALGTAQDAIKDEISRQANQAIQGARQKAESYVSRVVTTVKAAINDLITKIKSFFTDLFKKNAPTY